MVIIAGWPIDIAISEAYSFESEATQFPVEDGANISDHVRTGPLTITLECVVSDTPIGRIAADPSRAPYLIELEGEENPPTPSRDTFDRLVAIRDARKPVSVTTSRGTWENMVLSFQVPDDVTTARGLRFTATLKQIQVAENERVTLTVAAEPRGKPKAKRGALSASPGTAFESLPTSGRYLVVTVAPGEKPTEWWKQEQELKQTKLIAVTQAGNHYIARITATADGYVDPTGYYPSPGGRLPKSMRGWLPDKNNKDTVSAWRRATSRN